MAWLFSYKGYLYHSTAAPSLISLLNYLLPLMNSPEMWRFESHGNCWVMFSATTFKWLGNWVGNLKFKNKLKILNIYSFLAHIKCDLHPSNNVHWNVVVCNAVAVKIISIKMFIGFNLFEPVWTNLVQLSRKLHKLILQWLHGLWRHCAYLHDNSIKLYCRGVHLLTCRKRLYAFTIC